MKVSYTRCVRMAGLGALVVITAYAGGQDANQSQWTMSTFSDVMGGKSGIILGLKSDAMESYQAELKIQCHGKSKVEFVIDTGKVIENLPTALYNIGEAMANVNGQHLVPDYQRMVRIKFDDAKPKSETWEVGQQVGTVFASHGKDHLKKALTATALYFQFKPYGENQITVRFPIAGLNAYKSQLKSNCGVD